MKKTAILTIFVALLGFSASSQDLIVTTKGDSLNCKITKFKSDFIYFTMMQEGKILNTLIKTDEVVAYKKNYFAFSDIPLDKTRNLFNDYPKLRIGALGGWSYLTAPISKNVPDDFEKYIKELKSGYHFGGNFTYFPANYFGFGLLYTNFRTSNQIDDIYIVNNETGEVRTGKLRDDVTVQYFGPAIALRANLPDSRVSMHLKSSIGYIGYKNEAIVIDEFMLKSATVGLYSDMGVDIPIDRNLSLGIYMSFTIGFLTNYDYTDGTESRRITLEAEDYENISRIDLSVGLSWNR